MKTISAVIFFFFSVSESFAQIKVPTYIFGVGNHECGDKLSSYEGPVILQFFADSTFTITNYRVVSTFFYQVQKTEHKGKYVKESDTLFLKDSTSIGYPFIKDANAYTALGKDVNLKLFPAKIILAKDKNTYKLKGTYLSYLNIPRELKSIDFLCVINLQMEYERAMWNRFW